MQYTDIHITSVIKILNLFEDIAFSINSRTQALTSQRLKNSTTAATQPWQHRVNEVCWIERVELR